MRGRGRVNPPRVGRVGLRLALGAVLVASACAHRPLERMLARGEYEAVVERAGGGKRAPKRRAARAYAKALATLGRVEEARTVLLRDFRTSGDVASMVALADLEAERGIFGMAVAHYSRAATLDPESVAGREDVCELLRRRAAVYLADGEALAADQDLRRMEVLCPGLPGSAQGLADAALAARVGAEAKAAARLLRTVGGCDEGQCVVGRSARAGEVEVALAAARAKGPRALRSVARELEVQLSADDIVTLLRAELDGGLGVALVSNDELRAWIGEQAIDDLGLAANAVPDPALKAYVRLRLGRMGPGYSLPSAENEPGSEAALVTLTLDNLDESGPLSSALGWRVLALIGDLGAAEMTLVSGLRATSKPRLLELEDDDVGAPGDDSRVDAGAGAGRERSSSGSAQSAVPPPSYASGRSQVDADTWRLMLVLAHMRAGAGSEDQALEIIRYTLAEAQALGFADVEESAHEESVETLARGRPWQAMAIADAVGGIDAVYSAASAELLLQRAACADGCGEKEDRAVVERVLGEAWVRARGAELTGLAARRGFVTERAPESCPELRELLAPDALGGLSEGLEEARRPTAKSAERKLRMAVEADISLSCAGRLATPVMVDRGYQVGAAIIMQHLSQAPQMIAADALATHAEVALAAGKEEQARSLYDAAAASSTEPAAIWRRAAWIGQLGDARELELVALRRILLFPASPSLTRQAHRALVVRALRDANDAWSARSSDFGAEALGSAVVDYIERYASAERWWARENLARALAEEVWLDDEAAALVRRSLWRDPELAQMHPAASRRLEAALRGGALPGRIDLLSPEELASSLATSEAEFGPMTRLFDATALAGLRVARAELELDPLGRRLAIAVAVTGESEARAEALGVLLRGLSGAGEAERRRAVEELVLSELPALDPKTHALAPIVPEPEALLELLFDLGQRGPLERSTSG